MKGFIKKKFLLFQQVEKLILLGEPLVFRGGSAEILGFFKIASDRLVVELAQIEEGGEGVRISLASLAKRYVSLRKLSGGEWIVHAATCAKPDLKLRRVLERRGFVVKNVDGIGEAYYLLEAKPQPPPKRQIDPSVMTCGGWEPTCLAHMPSKCWGNPANAQGSPRSKRPSAYTGPLPILPVIGRSQREWLTNERAIRQIEAKTVYHQPAETWAKIEQSPIRPTQTPDATVCNELYRKG